MSNYDRYMLQVGAGKHVKFRRLSVAERYAFFNGILSLAARSPVRGCLMIGRLAAEAADVAAECDVPEKVAAGAMDKLRDLGILEPDGNGFEWVHDFEDYNPAPKQDRTAAQRQQRKRDRQRASQRDVTPVTDRDGVTVTARHAPEVEEEEKRPPNPQGGGVRFDRKPVPTERLQLAEHLHADFNLQAGTGYGAWTGNGKPSEGLKRIIGGLTARPDVTEDWAKRAVQWQLDRPFWDGPAQPGVVYGPGTWDKALEATKLAPTTPDDRRERFRAMQGKIA